MVPMDLSSPQILQIVTRDDVQTCTLQRCLWYAQCSCWLLCSQHWTAHSVMVPMDLSSPQILQIVTRNDVQTCTLQSCLWFAQCSCWLLCSQHWTAHSVMVPMDLSSPQILQIVTRNDVQTCNLQGCLWFAWCFDHCFAVSFQIHSISPSNNNWIYLTLMFLQRSVWTVVTLFFQSHLFKYCSVCATELLQCCLTNCA